MTAQRWIKNAKGEYVVETQATREIPEAFSKLFELTKKEVGLMMVLNSEIKKLTGYGTRFVEIKSTPVHELTWSNGSASWYVGRSPLPVAPSHQRNEWGSNQLLDRPVKIGDEVYLDANETIAYASREEIEKVVKLLIPLPLYSYSFEAKDRGLYPANLPPPPETGHWLWEVMPRWLKDSYKS